MKPIILLGILLALTTQTWRASAQSNSVPPTQLVDSARQIAAYLNHNYTSDPDSTDLSQDVYTDHNLWFLSWGNNSGDSFDLDFDLENNCLMDMSDGFARNASKASKLSGAPISVTAAQANQVVQNFHQFLGLGEDWRLVDTFLSPTNGKWRLWYCKYSLFVNGYYSREESVFGRVNAYSLTMDSWVRRGLRTYVPVAGPLLSFNQAQQIESNVTQRNVVVQEVRGLATHTDPLWTVVDSDIFSTPICRLAYVSEVVPLPGEYQSPRALAIDAQTGESWLQLSDLYMMGEAHGKLKSPVIKIKSERFQMIDRLAHGISLAPLLRSIASGKLLKRAPKEKPVSFEREVGKAPILFSLYPKSRTLSWSSSTGKWAGVQLSKLEMTLFQK